MPHERRPRRGLLQGEAIRGVVEVDIETLQRTGKIKPRVEQITRVGVNDADIERFALAGNRTCVRGHALRVRGA